MKGNQTYIRILGAREFGLGIDFQSDGTPCEGMTVAIHLVVLSSGGARLDSQLVNTIEFPAFDPQQPVSETLFEVVPRIALSEDGFIFVQRDPYRWDVECFTRDLTLQWRLQRDIEPLERTAAELEARRKINMGLEPGPLKHFIRRMIPREGGEVWIETVQDGPSVRDGLLLDQIDRRVEHVGSVKLTGLPDAAGEFRTFGNRVLWKLHDDFDLAEAGADPPPYLAAFRLVED